MISPEQRKSILIDAWAAATSKCFRESPRGLSPKQRIEWVLDALRACRLPKCLVAQGGPVPLISGLKLLNHNRAVRWALFSRSQLEVEYLFYLDSTDTRLDSVPWRESQDAHVKNYPVELKVSRNYCLFKQYKQYEDLGLCRPITGMGANNDLEERHTLLKSLEEKALAELKARFQDPVVTESLISCTHKDTLVIVFEATRQGNGFYDYVIGQVTVSEKDIVVELY